MNKIHKKTLFQQTNQGPISHQPGRTPQRGSLASPWGLGFVPWGLSDSWEGYPDIHMEKLERNQNLTELEVLAHSLC